MLRDRFKLVFILGVVITTSLFGQAQSPAVWPNEFRQMCFSKDDNIYLRDLKIGTTKLVRKGYDPHLSASGKFLAFTTYVKGKNPNDPDRTIQVLNLETNQLQGFKALNGFNAYGAIWSPDETKIALHILGKDTWQVGILNPASGELQILTKGLPGIKEAYLSSWLPDSKSIVCTDLSFVYEIELSGNVAQKISVQNWPVKVGGISSGTLFSFSSDRQFLLYDSEYPDVPGSIQTYDVAQKKFTRVTPPKFNSMSPQWLPGEKEIVFTNFKQINKRNPTYDLYKIVVGQSRPVLLMRNVKDASFAR